MRAFLIYSPLMEEDAFLLFNANLDVMDNIEQSEGFNEKTKKYWCPYQKNLLNYHTFLGKISPTHFVFFLHNIADI